MEKYSLQDALNDYTDSDTKKVSVSGGGAKNKYGKFASGRVDYSQPIDKTSDIHLGASGHYAKGEGWKDKGIDRVDAEYSKKFKDESKLKASLGANVGQGKKGIDSANISYEIPFKKGGKVTASSRADGCCVRGKTKGQIK
jgi:hypothetical protein